MIKTYVIKDELTNIKTGERQTYYTGKGGRVTKDKYFCEGYKTEAQAQRYIKNQLESYEIINENTAIEQEIWFHFITIEEVQRKESSDKVILRVSPFLARVIARMITDETNNQNEWKQGDEKNGRDTEHRDTIIKELDELQSQLTAQGVSKFIYYN